VVELLLLLSRECNNQPLPSIAMAGGGWRRERHRLNSRMSLSQPCLPSNHHVLAHMLAHRPADNKGEKNNQLAMVECDEKGEGGKAMAMGIRVAGDEESKGDEAGDDVGNEGGVLRRERWLWWQERWQQGWQAIDGDKGDGDGDGDDVGGGDGDEADGQQRGQG